MLPVWISLAGAWQKHNTAGGIFLRRCGGILQDAGDGYIGHIVDILGVQCLTGIRRPGEGIVVPDDLARFVADHHRQIEPQDKIQRNVAQNGRQLFVIRRDAVEAEEAVKSQSKKFRQQEAGNHYAAHNQGIQLRKAQNRRVNGKEDHRQNDGQCHTM